MNLIHHNINIPRANSAAYMRAWRKIDREAKLAKCRAYRLANAQLLLRQAREERRRVKVQVIAAYGGQCACCGESSPDFLTIDHVHNNGAAHRRSLGGYRSKGGHTFYSWLRRQGYPKGEYQLLCYNCNCAKQYSPSKVCPHVMWRVQKAS